MFAFAVVVYVIRWPVELLHLYVAVLAERIVAEAQYRNVLEAEGA